MKITQRNASFDQGRCHHQKITGYRDIQLLHYTQITEILVSNPCYRNVVDTDLFLSNKMKKKIEWTFKLAQEDLEIICHIIRNDRRHCAGNVELRRRLACCFQNCICCFFVHFNSLLQPIRLC